MKQKLYWLFPHLEQDGGGTKFLLEVTARLSQKYDITILCNTGKPAIIKSFQKHKIKVRTISFLSANSNVYWLFMPIFLLYDFFIYASHLGRANVIISTMYPSNLLGYMYTRLHKKPHFHYCYEPFPYLHDQHFIAQQPGIKKHFMRVFAFLYAWSDFLAVKGAKQVFTLNEITNRMIKKVYGRTAIVTRMGVDTTHFRKYTNNPIVKKYAAHLLIVHSTDYSRMKRTDLAITALKLVVKRFPNALLLITSTYPDSPHKKIYEHLVDAYMLSDNVEFLNYISYKDLPKYYSAARCYLSCSFDEMLGTTTSNLPVKEALACQTPAIRAPITKEDVVDGVSGYLVDPRKTAEVANKLAILLKDEKKAAQMGKKGRRTIVEHYSWDKVTQIIIQHLKNHNPS